MNEEKRTFQAAKPKNTAPPWLMGVMLVILAGSAAWFIYRLQKSNDPPPPPVVTDKEIDIEKLAQPALNKAEQAYRDWTLVAQSDDYDAKSAAEEKAMDAFNDAFEYVEELAAKYDLKKENGEFKEEFRFLSQKMAKYQQLQYDMVKGSSLPVDR